MNEEWCLIESDPGVFNDLLSTLGVKGVQVEEITSLTDDDLSRLYPIYGFIFLHMIKLSDNKETHEVPLMTVEEATRREVYFVRQSLPNACATVAILNLMMNIDPSEPVELGEVLSDFHDFTLPLDFETRGMALSNCEAIVKTHNKYKDQSLFDHVEITTGLPNVKRQNPFHYVVFMPIDGHLYELDGLQAGPKDCGGEDGGSGMDKNSWIRRAIEIMRQRMAYGAEIDDGQFNIMVVCGDLLKKYKEKHAEIVSATGNGIPTEEQMIEMARIESLVQHETEKMDRYKQENVFRLHNWTPFVIELLKLMATHNLLHSAVEKATKKEE